MSNTRRKKLKLKILSKFMTISEFCETAGISRQYMTHIISGRTFGGKNTWDKIKAELEIPDEEISEYQKIDSEASPPVTRKKLKQKIKSKFGEIKIFCKELGIVSSTMVAIFSGARDGTFELWSKFQKALEIPDEEMWGYMKGEEVKDENAEQ